MTEDKRKIHLMIFSLFVLQVLSINCFKNSIRIRFKSHAALVVIINGKRIFGKSGSRAFIHDFSILGIRCVLAVFYGFWSYLNKHFLDWNSTKHGELF